MRKSLTITAAALISAVAAGAAFAAPGDREFYPGASRGDMNMERGADAYGAPAATTYDDGAVDTMSTGSISRGDGVRGPYIYGDSQVNKTYEPGAGDYYQGATAPR